MLFSKRNVLLGVLGAVTAVGADVLLNRKRSSVFDDDDDDDDDPLTPSLVPEKDSESTDVEDLSGN